VLSILLIGFTLYRLRVRPPIAAELPSELTAVVMPTSQVAVANAMHEADSGEGLTPVFSPLRGLEREGDEDAQRPAD